MSLERKPVTMNPRALGGVIIRKKDGTVVIPGMKQETTETREPAKEIFDSVHAHCKDVVLSNMIAIAVEDMMEDLVARVTKNVTVAKAVKPIYDAEFSPEALAEMIMSALSEQDRFDSPATEEDKDAAKKIGRHLYNKAFNSTEAFGKKLVSVKGDIFKLNPITAETDISRGGFVDKFDIAYVRTSDGNLLTNEPIPVAYTGRGTTIFITREQYIERASDKIATRKCIKDVTDIMELKLKVKGLLKNLFRDIPRDERGKLVFSSEEYQAYCNKQDELVSNYAEEFKDSSILEKNIKNKKLGWISREKFNRLGLALPVIPGVDSKTVAEWLRFYLPAEAYYGLYLEVVGDNVILKVAAQEAIRENNGHTEKERHEWANETLTKEASEKTFEESMKISKEDFKKYEDFLAQIEDNSITKTQLVAMLCVEQEARSYGLLVDDGVDIKDSKHFGTAFRTFGDAVKFFNELIDCAATSADTADWTFTVEKAVFDDNGKPTGEVKTVALTTASLFARLESILNHQEVDYLSIDLPEILGFKENPKYKAFLEWRNSVNISKMKKEMQIQDLAASIEENHEINRLIGEPLSCLNIGSPVCGVLKDQDGIEYHSISEYVNAQAYADPAVRRALLEKVYAETDGNQKKKSSEFIARVWADHNADREFGLTPSDRVNFNKNHVRFKIEAVLQRAMIDQKFRETLGMVIKNGLKFTDDAYEYLISKENETPVEKFGDYVNIYYCVGGLIADGKLPTLAQLQSIEATAANAEANAQ